MKIFFDIEDADEDDRFERNWPTPPEALSMVRFSDDKKNRTFVVTLVHWGDVVNGKGEPILADPCAVVDLKEMTGLRERKLRDGRAEG
jgi:hypothetical protein